MEGGSSDEPSAQLLESSRFWIQRVLIPIVVFIGVAGNGVSVIVLTRKRMLCTTTIYLTALAVADVIYLIFVLILSFQHYPNIKDGKYEFYWSFFAISHWICDAASNTSVWLTVSFTVERYIVVCHPIKGKFYCTEGRAKCIIAIVYVICLVTSISTVFEHELYSECLQKCPLPDLSTSSKDLQQQVNMSHVEELFRTHKKLQSLSPTDKMKAMEIYKHHEENNTEHLNTTEEYINKHFEITAEMLRNDKSTTTRTRNATEKCCKSEIGVKLSPLALNKTYEGCFFWFTSLTFGVIPLILIAYINCILVYSMFKSRKQRRRMTIKRREKQQNHESRITLLLIVVIILFLICQTPTASFLIYDTLDPVQDKTNKPYGNYKKTCGNIFNFLVAVNASMNFVLYCVFSKRYRKTFKEIFCQRKVEHHDVYGISRLSSKSTAETDRFSALQGHHRRNNSEYLHRTPRNLETNSLPLRSKSMLARTGKHEIHRI